MQNGQKLYAKTPQKTLYDVLTTMKPHFCLSTNISELGIDNCPQSINYVWTKCDS